MSSGVRDHGVVKCRLSSNLNYSLTIYTEKSQEYPEQVSLILVITLFNAVDIKFLENAGHHRA